MKTCTRQEAIDDLRQAILEAAGDEHSICFVAAQKHIFCHGFDQWKLHELKALYPQITRSRKRLTRKQMEILADSWQMARQFVNDSELACDMQPSEGEFQTCRGWDEFDDEQLSRFHNELCGEDVCIVAEQRGNA